MSEACSATPATPPAAGSAGPAYGTLIKDGVWSNNPVLAQMIGLCPALAVTGSATNGLGMGLATTAVLVLSNVLIASIRNLVSPNVRIPVFIVLIASLVTLIDMSMNAWMYDLYQVLGLFIALIVVNCAILGRAEAFASKNPVGAAAVDGFAMGLGFTATLVVLGGIREVLGSGTLFAGASQMLGTQFAFLEFTVIPDYKGFLMMILPPGAFFVIAFLIAGHRLIEEGAKRKAERKAAQPALPAGGAAV
ncbi:electron transport complex subunit E [Pseudothauera rhizosphaerae]|uniref:Ion-translocating oxidoreductase complex subunit E n=1 Tax=Pseudothauera rhizosphaerae TaxID=2565932 RepID=A0A4S4AR64_9RHOO|nr:electron transport complex subunit E [Pseudothauera rhizosphaerae]THF62207.1 electron transport complex subunit E [Pseudothauera rhizosphaerae]